MPIRVIPKSQQGQGEFNGGQIVENKPIGFPQDHSTVRPYSNLFYWAHARAVTDSTIGLHPHKGFEICSFVLKGEIRHYDTKLREWRPLQAGDVQIIRAGNGISHSEFMAEGAEMFQIWFDPNLAKTLEQPASYDDYRAEDFPETTQAGVRIKTLVGPGSPFRMDTPGIAVTQIDLKDTPYTLAAEADKIYAAYIINGTASFASTPAQTSDFVLFNGLDSVDIQSENGATIFLIGSPLTPAYRTYAQAKW